MTLPPIFNQLDLLTERKKELIEQQNRCWLLGTACKLLNLQVQIDKVVERLKI